MQVCLTQVDRKFICLEALYAATFSSLNYSGSELLRDQFSGAKLMATLSRSFQLIFLFIVYMNHIEILNHSEICCVLIFAPMAQLELSWLPVCWS
ncbi:hypothetical protein AMTRI_Chr03g46120 [Amborella trichopoda]